MESRTISVVFQNNKWEVVFKHPQNDKQENKDIIITMHSKEAAVRYARICEQRTGNKVQLPQ